MAMMPSNVRVVLSWEASVLQHRRAIIINGVTTVTVWRLMMSIGTIRLSHVQNAINRVVERLLFVRSMVLVNLGGHDARQCARSVFI